MKSTKLKNIAFNSITGILSYIFVFLATFFTRKVLVQELGAEILGLNSLFSNIITVLSITELGIGTAMVIFLYEPIQNRNKEKTKSIMHFYKNTYLFLAVMIFILGLIIELIVLKVLVKTSIDFDRVQWYFFLFLINTIFTYLFSYKKSILYAEQKNYITSITYFLSRILFSMLEIITLLLYHNYSVYLTLVIISNIVDCSLCNLHVNKYHSYINDRVYTKLTKEEKLKIVKIIKPMFVQRIASTILTTTNSILITFFVSIVITGIYSNYEMIILAIISVFSQISSVFTSAFGNVAICETKERCYELFQRASFAMHWFIALMSICFLLLIQDFIQVFFGSEYLLSSTGAILLSLYLYLYLKNVIMISIQNALGIHQLDQLSTIYQTVFNLIFSAVFGYIWGFEGIMFGTVLSMLIFPTIFKSKCVYETVFGKGANLYYSQMINDFVKCIMIFIISKIILNIFENINFYILIIEAVVAFFIVNLGLILLNYTNQEFKYYLHNMDLFKRKE